MRDTRPAEYLLRLEEALEYENFIARGLLPEGIVVQLLTSRKSQHLGETMSGLEIKNDRRFRETGNLYFETAQKTFVAQGEFQPSSVFRDDNTWLLGIGDEQDFWIFDKNWLQRVSRAGTFRTVETPTSQGFLMPIKVADEYCARHFKFGD